LARALASNDELPYLPVDIVERHQHDLLRAQAQSGQDEQDGEIALAGGCPLITLPEQALDLVRHQRFWQRGQSPVGHGENRARQVVLQVATKT
jgi:hypothetical protein